jgi:hypothetical protein
MWHREVRLLENDEVQMTRELCFSSGSSLGFSSSFSFGRPFGAAGLKKIFHIKFVAIYWKLV